MGISPSLSLSLVVVLPTNFLAQLSPSPTPPTPRRARHRSPAVRALVWFVRDLCERVCVCIQGL